MQHLSLGPMTEEPIDKPEILMPMPKPGEERSIYICLSHVKTADFMHPKWEGCIIINSLIFVVLCKNILYCLNLGKNYLWTRPASNKKSQARSKNHTAIFIGQTGCGKTHSVLRWIEKECNKHFDYIIIICPTLRENSKNYDAKEWIKNDDNVWLVDPKDNLQQWIKKLSELLRSLEVLFIIEDIIANESLDKRRQPLLELSISGRHRCHYLWLLTQSYTAIPKYSRRQSKGIFVWHPKERRDLKMIHDENDALTYDELVVARNFLKKPKHACLLWQSRQLLNTDVPSSADLICFAMEKTLLLPHLKQVYNVFSRVFHGFSSCLITRFTFSVAESKTECSKIGSMFVSSFFTYTKKGGGDTTNSSNETTSPTTSSRNETTSSINNSSS